MYYVPAQVFYNGVILPTLISLLPLLREILIREEIDIVHGHGAWSSLGHDALFAAKLLNIKVKIRRCGIFSCSALLKYFSLHLRVEYFYGSLPLWVRRRECYNYESVFGNIFD